MNKYEGVYFRAAPMEWTKHLNRIAPDIDAVFLTNFLSRYKKGDSIGMTFWLSGGALILVDDRLDPERMASVLIHEATHHLMGDVSEVVLGGGRVKWRNRVRNPRLPPEKAIRDVADAIFRRARDIYSFTTRIEQAHFPGPLDPVVGDILACIPERPEDLQPIGSSGGGLFGFNVEITGGGKPGPRKVA